MPATVTPSPEIWHRDQFGNLLNARGLLGRAAEIGTDKGAFAVRFLNVWRGNLLICIDPWETQLPGYHELTHERESDFLLSIAALSRFNWRVRIVREESAQAAGHFYLKSPLDFCYIDGNHAYDYVAADLANYWPKLSPTGILAGHDYCPKEFPGVVRAVNEFAAAHHATVYLTREPYASWYLYRTQPQQLLSCHRWLPNIKIEDATPPPGPTLSLCIASLSSRKPLLHRLLAILGNEIVEGGLQAAVEVLVEVDDGAEHLASKRNRLLTRATGRYIAFADDDDRVAPDYFRRILEAIRQNPGVDVITFEGLRQELGREEVEGAERLSHAATPTQRLDYRLRPGDNYKSTDPDGTERRHIQANHLCPVRREIALASRYWVELPYGSDQPYWKTFHAAGLLTSECHLGAPPLYFYDFDWRVTATQRPDQNAATFERPEHVLCLFRVAGECGLPKGSIVHRVRSAAIGNSEEPGTIRVQAADGSGHTLPVNVLEELPEVHVR